MVLCYLSLDIFYPLSVLCNKGTCLPVYRFMPGSGVPTYILSLFSLSFLLFPVRQVELSSDVLCRGYFVTNPSPPPIVVSLLALYKFLCNFCRMF